MKTWLLHAVTFAVAAGLIGIGILALPETLLAAQNDGRPTITVQIYNYSPASPEIVARAEREAGLILGAAGLQPVWLECPVKPPTSGSPESCQKAPASHRPPAADTASIHSEQVSGLSIRFCRPSGSGERVLRLRGASGQS